MRPAQDVKDSRLGRRLRALARTARGRALESLGRGILDNGRRAGRRAGGIPGGGRIRGAAREGRRRRRRGASVQSHLIPQAPPRVPGAPPRGARRSQAVALPGPAANCSSASVRDGGRQAAMQLCKCGRRIAHSRRSGPPCHGEANAQYAVRRLAAVPGRAGEVGPRTGGPTARAGPQGRKGGGGRGSE